MLKMSAARQFARLLALSFAFALPAASHAAILQAWTQYAAGGVVEARAIVDDATCPTASLDTKNVAMTERHHPDADFAVRSCATPVPAGTKAITIGTITLHGPVARPQRILVLGDTGCRISKKENQACKDPTAWPYAQLAARAAAEHPDLVIHVGDYFYREAPCPADATGCAGVAYGQNWPAWDADVFQPATPLLQAATWIAVRGNHEDCQRGGAGWTAFLGWDPIGAPCTPHEAPLLVDLGGLRVAVLDDNDSDDKPKEPIATAVAHMHTDAATLLAANPDWLLSHHPTRGVSKLSDKHEVDGFNATLDAALHGLAESKLSLRLSGHIHNFQYENYADPAYPPQLVTGMGGDRLDVNVPETLGGLKSGDAVIKDGKSVPGFGYIVMERQADGSWAFDVHDIQGAVLTKCWVKDHKVGCS